MCQAAGWGAKETGRDSALPRAGCPPSDPDDDCPALLAQPSQLKGFAGAKPFRISRGYPKVFTTKKGAGDLF